MRSETQTLLFVGVMAVLVYLVIPPLVFVVQTSFLSLRGFETQGLSLRNYVTVLSAPDMPRLVVNSLTFAIGSSIVGLILGTSLAWLVERTNTPFRRVSYLAAFISIAVPGIIKVVGWILLLGPRNGLLNVWLGKLFGADAPIFNIFSMPGMVLVEGILWTPVVFLLMAVPFRSMDPALEEASSIAGAGHWRTFYYVTFKLATPSVLSVLLLTFIRSMEAFEIPALIGIPSRVMVFTTEIYLKSRRGFPPNYGEASAYSVILMLLVALGIFLYSRATRVAQQFYTITGRGFRPKLIDLGRWRYFTGALILLLPLLIILPIAILLWASIVPVYTQPSLQSLALLTLQNYFGAFENSNVQNAVRNTLIIALISATFTMLITAVAAWLIVRTRLPHRWALDMLASFTLVFPGVVLGVALIRTYLILPIPIYGTIWILIIAYLTRFVSYGMRYSLPGILQIHQELEESSMASGASWSATFRRIVVPLMMPALFGGWIWVFLISVRELSIAVMLSGPRSQVISVALFELWEDGQLTEMAAFAMVVTAGVTALATLFHRVSQHYGVHA
jgi:iron(III) transport system permease protein